MAVDFASAVSAYKFAARMATEAPDQVPTAEAEGPAPRSFSTMVTESIQNAIETGRTGESMTRAAIEGKADLRDVVMAVNNAEVTLQTVISIRDKVVSAYESILRMPV